MPNVIIRRYNTFFDHRTNVQFDPVLDVHTGLYIGLAHVTDEQILYFSKIPAYEVVTDARLAQITSGEFGQADKKPVTLTDPAALSASVLNNPPKLPRGQS